MDPVHRVCPLSVGIVIVCSRGVSGGSVRCPYVICTSDRAGKTCGKPHSQHRSFSCLDNAWRAEFGDEAERPRWAELFRSGVDIFALDAILPAMYALSVSAKGDCYLCVPPDPGIEAAALGASESALPGTAPAEALHTFMLDSSASRCFFRDSFTLTPLSAPVPVRLADPSRGPVLAYSSTVLPCSSVPSGSLSGLRLPSFSTNLVSTAALQDALVTTTTPGGQRVSICTCIRTGYHLVTFTHWTRSSLYTLTTEPPQVAAFAQVSASGPVAPPCSCRLLLYQTLLWHHRLGHPSVPRLRGMHSRLLVSGLPKSLPPLPPSPASPCLPCVEGRQRAAPHPSSFPPTTAPLSMLIAPKGDPDAPDIPTPRSYIEAFTGPYSSQWETAMDAEMAYHKSTGTYIDAVPPSRANIVDGMWIFRVKRPPGSPPVFKARYVARGFRQRQGVYFFQTFSPTPKMTTLRVLLHVAVQRDYELHSLEFSTAFLQGSLHEEIWLRHPPGFTGLFPLGTQWSLRRPFYGLRQAPREWHDTLTTLLAALGFAPLTVDPPLFLRSDTLLPPFYVLPARRHFQPACRPLQPARRPLQHACRPLQPARHPLRPTRRPLQPARCPLAARLPPLAARLLPFGSPLAAPCSLRTALWQPARRPFCWPP
ncbi:unnamed protein product [Closterium sp. NIES-54]